MDGYCYYGRIAVDSLKFRQLNGVHVFMTKELIEKLIKKAVSRLDKDILELLKPLTFEIKKLSKELKLLTDRVKKLEPPKIPKVVKAPAKKAKTAT